MALPFALVISVGRYLFLFLSIYTASYSPYLHLVQTALPTVRWFNLGDDSRNRLSASRRLDVVLLTTRFSRRAAMIVVASHPGQSHPRRQWDPGIVVAFESLSCHHDSNVGMSPFVVDTIELSSTMALPYLKSLTMLSVPNQQR